MQNHQLLVNELNAKVRLTHGPLSVMPGLEEMMGKILAFIQLIFPFTAGTTAWNKYTATALMPPIVFRKYR